MLRIAKAGQRRPAKKVCTEEKLKLANEKITQVWREVQVRGSDFPGQPDKGAD